MTHEDPLPFGPLPLRGRVETIVPVLELLEVLCAKEAIDPARIYVTGQSMGGAGTYAALTRRPELFAAAAPVCGSWEPEIAGRIAQHSSRGPIIAGLLIFGGSNLLMFDADANTALMTIILLSVIGRSGLGLIMPSLNLQGLRTLSSDLLPYGPGTLNFVRMLGAAAGVNIASVVLDRRFDFHRDSLKTTQTADNYMTADFFQRLGQYLDTAGFTGVERLSAMMSYLRQTIDGQANALAFQDIFVLLGIVFMVGLLPAFFMGHKSDRDRA